MVLTFKNVFNKKTLWREAHAAQLDRLATRCDNVRSLSLYANTPRECTVFATIRSDSGAPVAAPTDANAADAAGVDREPPTSGWPELVAR